MPEVSKTFYESYRKSLEKYFKLYQDVYNKGGNPAKPMETKMAKLYEVAILEKPTPKEAENGGIEKLVFGPVAVVAQDEKSAATAATVGKAIPGDPARFEVLVRPFK